MLNGKKIDLEEVKSFVKKICLDSTSDSKPNSLKIMQLRSYFNEVWNDLTNPAAKFLSNCINVLENKKEEIITQKKITELLKQKSF